VRRPGLVEAGAEDILELDPEPGVDGAPEDDELLVGQAGRDHGDPSRIIEARVVGSDERVQALADEGVDVDRERPVPDLAGGLDVP